MEESVASGELKSKMVANATDGGAAAEAKESTGLVANSRISRSKGKKNTTATDSLRLEQSLQIMRDCVDMVSDSGVTTEFSAFTTKSGKRCVLVVLQNVDLVNDDFVPVAVANPLPL